MLGSRSKASVKVFLRLIQLSGLCEHNQPAAECQALLAVSDRTGEVSCRSSSYCSRLSRS